ncbi:MAG: VPS10 domain-containing protein [Gemmatimonadaceae bacterium]
MRLAPRALPLVVSLLAPHASRLEAQSAAQRPIADASATLADSAIWNGLAWRNIGPVNMSGRVADVEGVPGNPNVVYVGSASGGVWKTTNGGISWKPIFDSQPVASIGDIALEPGNPDVIYVGTGEAKPRNSASYGNGVYKSTDGGATWKHIGLTNSERIARIIVSPNYPRVVYVGVLGHVYGPNAERGVYRSSNGGETWERVLYIDERHGVAELAMDPQNPNILYAGMWRFERKPWTHLSGSEEGGVFKSVDGGRTWSKLTKGIPKLLGRIAVQPAPSNPNVVYVLAESNDGTLFRSDDRGETFTTVYRNVDIVNRGFYFTKMRVDPIDENRVYAISGTMMLSIDAGKTFRRISNTTHVDYHSLWIDPLNANRLWQSQDGGVAVSYDRGVTWEPLLNIPVAQFYSIYFDGRAPFYNVGGGLQDNGTWTGPVRSREPGGIANDDWRMISFGDGFQIAVHPNDPDVFLSEFQGGGIVWTNMRTREQFDVSPQPRRNDGGPVKDLKYRFNWNSPIVQSPHDGKIVYFTGNVIFKTNDFGLGGWEQISPDLTTNDSTKYVSPGGPVWKENTTAEYHGTIISFAESVAQAGVLWAGTDDGNLQLSRDGGKNWSNLTARGPAVPRFSPVSHVEPSRAAAGSAYVAYDRHMFDDLRPYVFKTTDFGATWSDVSGNLPNGAYVHVLREDPKNPNLVYAGTELGFFASYTGGTTWQRLHAKNFPVVAVHDVLVHPVMNDLLLGTHGRAFWVLDDATPVQQMNAAARAKSAHLFPVMPAYRYSIKPTRYGEGDKLFHGPNPPYGAIITYYLKEKLDSLAAMKLEVVDSSGAVVREIKRPPRDAGLNRVAWDLAYDPPRPRRETTGPQPVDEFFGGPRGPQALPGRYTIRLTTPSGRVEMPVDVRLDPAIETPVAALKEQFDVALRLRDMQSVLNDTLRALDVTRAQLDGRKKTLETQGSQQRAEQIKQVDREIAQVDSLLATITRPPGRPFWSEGPRVAERLGALQSGIDGANRAPTKHQVSLFGELRTEYDAALRAVAAFLARATRVAM